MSDYHCIKPACGTDCQQCSEALPVPQAIDRLRAELAQAKRDRQDTEDVLVRSGFFRRCDIAACNCGSWHHVGGYAERFREIEDATGDDWRNGESLLARVKRIVAERDAALALLREFVELCAVGDVDENTEVLGWGDLIRRAKEMTGGSNG